MFSIEMEIFTALGESSYIRNTIDLISLKRRKEILNGAGACTQSVNGLHVCHYRLKDVANDFLV